jgi:hypothetical protein
VSASFEDIKIIATVCMWKNDCSLANMAFFLLALYYFSGRAYEIARLPFKRTKMYTPTEFSEGDSSCPDKLCQVEIWRTKTQHETSATIFNHRDSFLLDYYFLQSYSMLMHLTPPSEFLFYKFFNSDEPDSRGGTPDDGTTGASTQSDTATMPSTGASTQSDTATTPNTPPNPSQNPPPPNNNNT